MSKELKICMLGKQLQETADKIQSVAGTADGLSDKEPDIAEIFEHFLLDEISHVQMIALEMTRIITEGTAGNADDSVFAEGELTSVIGKKQEEPEQQ